MSRSPNQKNGKPKKTTAYRENKKAFDTVITHLRRMERPQLGPMGAVNLSRSSSPSMRNPVTPNAVEFRCDVLLAINAAMPKGVNFLRFEIAYLYYDSDDVIEQSKYAQKILGGRIHSVEQRIGAEFIRRKIWPEGQYMNPLRVQRSRKSL